MVPIENEFFRLLIAFLVINLQVQNLNKASASKTCAVRSTAELKDTLRNSSSPHKIVFAV